MENAWQNPKRQLSEQMKTKYKAQTLQDGPHWRKDVTGNVGWLGGNTKDRNQQNVLIRWSFTLPESLHCAYQFGTQTSPKMKDLPLSLWKLLHFLGCPEKHPSYTDLKQTKESLGRWFWDTKNHFHSLRAWEIQKTAKGFNQLAQRLGHSPAARLTPSIGSLTGERKRIPMQRLWSSGLSPAQGGSRFSHRRDWTHVSHLLKNLLHPWAAKLPLNKPISPLCPKFFPNFQLKLFN